MTVFLGIYRAIYDYEPQTPEELAIQENDLLYLLQKSDIDDWWTVKRRVIGSDSDEPVGLVPSTYIEEAPILKKVRAIYDYEQVQNADEELTFHENDVFNVLDDKDPDWLLVKSTVSNEFGFIPGNYVEVADNAAPKQEAAPTGAPAAAPAAGLPTSFLPPPQHIARKQQIEQDQTPEEEEEGPPPAMPARPRATTETTETTAMAGPAHNRLSYSDDDNNDDEEEDYDYYNSNNNSNSGANREYNTEYHSWNVTEIEGRKKKKAKLSIGNNKINFIPQKGAPHEWSIDKLVSYDNEKKHMFLEFVDPYRSLELHTGNTTTCEEIMSIIGEYKGASRDPGLKEVEMASKSKKRGVVQYDFLAESQDELTIKSGDKVYILDDKKSSDWWMCQLIDSGKSGLVPAQFVEPVRDKKHTESTASGIIKSIKKNFTKSPSRSRSRSRSKSNANASWKDDESQNDAALSTSGARSRKGSLSSHKKNSSTAGTKDFPNPKKSRLWVDRSGTFKVDAEFIGCAKGKIHLHKANGVKIAVAADKLCNEDLAYVEKITGFSLEKFKIHDGSSSHGTDSRDSERERRRRLKEQEEKERDRRLKERELYELKKARELLDEERARLKEKDLPPIKPPRPTSSVSTSNTTSQSITQNNNSNGNKYDWFEFFLNCGVDVSNCQRYTINFDREQITEDMMPDVDNSMLRTLGLREGDIVRVMKYLDKKFGRESNIAVPTNMTGNMFSQPDGSLNPATSAETSLPQQLLPQSTAPIATAPSASAETDDAWTVKPASKSESNLLSKKSEFTGSMQDLLDLQPLEPKKTSTTTPEPNLKDLQPVKTGGTAAPVAISSAPTPAPLDPFKTGGNNILPLSTGYVMMPMITGGAMLPMQRTGGFVVPQTTFGMQQQVTGGILPVQKTSNGLIAISNTGGAMMPQTTFGTTPTILPLQKTGGGLIPITTGGAQLPQTSFNIQMQQPLPTGTILPVQKTANGLISTNTDISMPPLQRTGGTMIAQPQITGGAMMPQTSFGVSQQFTGNAMMAQPQRTGGALNTFNTGGALNTFNTGGALNTFNTGGALNTFNTGGALNTFNTGAMMPQTSFNAQPQITGGFQPQSQFGLTLQKTGGIAPLNQNQFTGGAMSTFNVGGAMQQQPQQPQIMTTFNTGNAMQQPQMMNTFNTGGAMQQPQMMNTFNTGGAMQQPQVMSTFNTGGAMQQPQQQALQNQPTGFGFGNGPPQSRQANIFNATASNPFGF